ncbi:Glycosyltransferase involved in cell wall bisynthesis [Fodinibius roseus]|uniref:Glycosyltransferase involved in cell wall bisynthesis n=1 Tax=Fodinibius roseus TaxID=1194090 RepID=A0A1M4TGB1_9BACT|nr:glycosyltransferase [Fodinibius roseus]SHE43337.1 Glycosyltransferase involved in cell wall bisynthesis [Fodinibius roseus]
MKIVFLSHTPRNYLFKVGSYHLSNHLADLGHDVLYIPSPLSLFHFINIPMLGDSDYRNVIQSRMHTLTPLRDSDKVTNITPFVLTPFNKGVFDRPEIPMNQWFTFNRIDKKIKALGFDKADLVIQDKAGLFFMRKFINAQSWIYRATDDYSGMSGGPGKQSIQMLEQKICDFADRVLVTSGPLQQLFRERYGVEASILRNGVEASHFTGRHQKPEEYTGVSAPIILYVGSLDQRFDHHLLIETARQSPDFHYMIVGPQGKKNIPDDIENITILGPKPYAQIPAYMQHAEVGILPLTLTEANHARSPMKIYEYGISGLPVVSTPLRELKNRNEHFITFAKDSQHFHEQIMYCLDHKDKLAALARDSADKHSWRSITQQLLDLTTSNSSGVA